MRGFSFTTFAAVLATVFFTSLIAANVTRSAADAQSLTPPWCRHDGQHYGQNDACSWAGIMPTARSTRNVGAGYRLRWGVRRREQTATAIRAMKQSAGDAKIDPAMASVVR